MRLAIALLFAGAARLGACGRDDDAGSKLAIAAGDERCLVLRNTPSYDGREILSLTFAHDDRCERRREEGTPAATP